MVSDCARTDLCVAEARNPCSRFQSLELCSDCTCARPPVCCGSKGLRPRCRKRCFCDVRTIAVAQRCVSGSGNPWSRLRFVSGVYLHRHVCGVVVIACGRSREPVVSDVAHTHTHWARVISHTCTWPTQRSRDHCLHAHMCVLQKHGTRGHASWCLTAHADLVVMFDCVTSHRCVLQTHADMCVAEGGALVTWLRVVSSRTNTHTHLSHACAVCGISIEPRPWSVIAHTHMCAAEENARSRAEARG